MISAWSGPSFDRPFPPAANPWRPDRFTGGSSSGSAAAVAGGLVRTTVSSDTGGSIRSPAAYCGVVGLKPTYGTLPKEGAYPLAPSLDHLGPISASVVEAALTFDVHDGDCFGGGVQPAGASARIGRPLDGFRIGYARRWFARDPQLHARAFCAHWIDDAASSLRCLERGSRKSTFRMRALFEACGGVIVHAESFALHRDQLATKGDLYSDKIFPYFMAGIALE